MRILCPTCKQPAEIAHDAGCRPFCSIRCKAIDLGSWLDETYRVSSPMGPGDLEELGSANGEAAELE